MSIGVIAAHFLASDYLAEVAADSPRVWYRQDEAVGPVANDSSGNARHGTYTNGPTLGQPGPLFSSSGTAVLYNGTTQYITIANAAWMNALTAFTLEAWVKTTATSGTIIGRGATPSPYRLGMTGGKAFVEMTADAGGGTLLVSSLSSINDGAWHYVVGTWTGGSLVIYVEGASENSGIKTGNMITASTPLRVAQRNSDSFFAGTIAQAALYGTNIGPTRVAAHYAAR